MVIQRTSQHTLWASRASLRLAHRASLDAAAASIPSPSSKSFQTCLQPDFRQENRLGNLRQALAVNQSTI